jgi:hypothetical protein
MNSIKNILIVSHTEVFKGGSERSNLKLAKDFSDKNFNVSFLIPKIQKNNFYKGFDVIFTPKFNFQKEKKKVNYLRIFLILKSRLRYLLYLFRNKKKFKKFDIIILSTNRTISELIFFKFIKKRCFVINRGLDTKFLIRYVFLNFAEKVFFLNQFKINRVKKYISKRKIKFYHNQIDGKKYYNTNINNIISIGANTHAKGIDRFLDFIKIYKKGKIARFGERCNELTSYSKEKADHKEIYHFGQIVLMTTRNEDFPRVLLESFHHRKFLISYYWPGIEKFDEFIFFNVKSTSDIIKSLNEIKNLSSSGQNDILDHNESLVHKLYYESPIYKLINEF